jgi:hypothetical protein
VRRVVVVVLGLARATPSCSSGNLLVLLPVVVAQARRAMRGGSDGGCESPI